MECFFSFSFSPLSVAILSHFSCRFGASGVRVFSFTFCGSHLGKACRVWLSLELSGLSYGNENSFKLVRLVMWKEGIVAMFSQGWHSLFCEIVAASRSH